MVTPMDPLEEVMFGYIPPVRDTIHIKVAVAPVTGKLHLEKHKVEV